MSGIFSLLLVCLIVYFSISSPSASDTEKPSPTVPPEQKQVVASLDPDRDAAEALGPHADLILLMLGTGRSYTLQPGKPVPPEQFRLQGIRVRKSALLSRKEFFDHLDRLEGVKEIADIENQLVWQLGDLERVASSPSASQIQILMLPKVKFTGGMISALKGLPALRDLTIDASNVDDAILTQMAESIPQLKALELSFFGNSGGVSAKGMTALASLKPTRLILREPSQLNRTWFTPLAQAGSLQLLGVSFSNFDDEMLAEFDGDQVLTSLYLQETQITDQAMPLLAGMNSLNTLNLRNKAITNEALPHLSQLKRLRTLDLRETQVTEQEVEHLASYLPYCRIDWDGGGVRLNPPIRNVSPDFLGWNDLTGWQGNLDRWSVSNGEIIGKNPDKESLVLASENPARNFRLAFYARISLYDPKSSEFTAGLRFRRKGEGEQDEVALLQIDPGPDLLALSKGEEWTSLEPRSEEVRATYQLNGYCFFEIIVIDQHITVWVNGIHAAEGVYPELPEEGILAWEMSPNCSEFRIRYISFNDLTLPPETEPLISEDWVWSPPENLGETINGSGNEMVATLSEDGLIIVFMVERDGQTDLYEARRTSLEEPFGNLRRLDELGDNGVSEIHMPHLTQDGLRLIFVSDRPNRSGMRALWISTRSNQEAFWGTPQLSQEHLNAHGGVAWPALPIDRTRLYFTQIHPSTDSWDLHVKRRSTASHAFSPPVWLGPEINTEQYEGDPCPLGDGNSLVFIRRASDGSETSPQTWMLATPLYAGKWRLFELTRPEEFAINPYFFNDGRTVIFASQRTGGQGGYDLWISQRIPKADPPSEAPP